MSETNCNKLPPPETSAPKKIILEIGSGMNPAITREPAFYPGERQLQPGEQYIGVDHLLNNLQFGKTVIDDKCPDKDSIFLLQADARGSLPLRDKSVDEIILREIISYPMGFKNWVVRNGKQKYGTK